MDEPSDHSNASSVTIEKIKESQMGNKKHFGEEDRVLRFAVIAVAALFFIAAIVIAGRMGNLREDSAAGEEKLEQMAKMNVQRNELRIQELENARDSQDDQDTENQDPGSQGEEGQDTGDQSTEDQDAQSQDAEDQNAQSQDAEHSEITIRDTEEKKYTGNGDTGESEEKAARERVLRRTEDLPDLGRGLELLLGFLPVILILYYVLPGRLKDVVILVGGVLLYAWGEPAYVFLVIFSVLFNYMSGIFIAGVLKEKRKARRRLVINIAVNLGLLFVFRYAAPVLEGINDIFQTEIRYRELPVPVGISFYTLQALSYTIDVYQRRVKVQRSLVDFAVYVTLFPRLIAGPVVKYKDMTEQLRGRKTSLADFGDGSLFFIRGLAKKLLLADAAGRIIDVVFAMEPGEMSVLSAWLGCLAFMFRIYFELGAFSDMAVGLGRMFGFEFRQNFAYPYMAKSITDFWRRWYISLVSWFQDYVGLPLSGKRRTVGKDIRSILVVWLLIGLWYGASWNYILWGLYYGILLVVEKYITANAIQRLPGAVTRFFSLLLIIAGWVLFFSPTPGSALAYLGRMAGIGGSGLTDARGIYLLMSNVVLWFTLIFCSTPLIFRLYEHFIYSGKRARTVMNTAVYAVLFFLCMIYMI